MARRFEEFYQIKKGDNLGEPEFWNRKLEDLDLRLAARELDGAAIAAAVDQLISVGLSRINDTFTPVIDEAIDRLQSVGAAFSSTSDTEATIDTDPKTFALDPSTWASFVVTDYVAIRPADHTDRGIVAQVTAYDRDTGLLDVVPVLIIGSGTYSDWLVRPTPAPDIEHATRTDNPHETTAAQVGAYTTAQTDAAILALKNQLLGGAGPAFDTLQELATALGSDAAFSTTIANALAKRVRFDAAQALTLAERHRHHANVIGSPLAALASRNLYSNPRMDVSQQLGTTGAVLSSGVPLYAADEMLGIYTAGSGAALVDRPTSSSFAVALPGFDYGARLMATTALGSLANGTGRAQHYFAIEYTRTSGLQWGTARARRLGYAFQYCSTNAGVIMLRWQNAAGDRYFYQERAVAAGWNLISGTVEGDTGGSWLPGATNIGLILAVVCAGAEATPQTSLDAWGTTLKLKSAGMSGNLLNTNNSQTILTGLVLVPDMHFGLFDQTDLAAALPDMCIAEDDAYERLIRYFWRSPSEWVGWGFGVGANQIIGLSFTPRRMRAAFAITPVGALTGHTLQYYGVNATTTSWSFGSTGDRAISFSAAGGTIVNAASYGATVRFGFGGAASYLDCSARML